MAAKKPSAKATKAKKTVVKKADSPKKSAVKKAAAPVRKPVAAPPRPAAKPAAKATASAPLKPVKAAPAPKPEPVAAAATKSAAPAAAKATAIVRPAPVPPPSQQNDAEANADSEDGDSPEASTNLLAGPRNVKPYIPRRGEQYMGKEQLEHFRQILNTWKRDLMHEVDRTVLHMKDEAANFPDPNDRATQESEFSLELRTRDRERKLIRKIDEAIKRIEDGSYGYCVETGEEIGIKRLEARPVATLCVEAQERRERREKQYGDRDDRYR
jgi:RNA polymerase-binding transcription factor